MADKKDLEVKTSIKRVDSEKKNEYLNDSKTIDEDIKEKNEQVKKNREISEKEKKEKETEDDNIKTLSSALNALTNGKKSKGFFAGVLLGIIIGCMFMITIGPALGIFSTMDNGEKVIDKSFASYTTVDFRDAILSSSKVKEDLEVLEQAVIVPITITKAGFANLTIFSKVKECEFVGSGIYTVNMGRIDYDHMDYDAINGVLTVYIPHAVLSHVIIDEQKTQFHDTENGFLSFGDLKLTSEEYNEITKGVKDTMTEELSQKDLLELADDYATKKVWKILNPLIETVTRDVILEVEFIK